MTNENRYGLSRTIPEDVARQVRQRAGFGCIICGNALYQYDHFDPEFNQAKEHNANAICLLCARCHSRKTKKLLSLETLRLAASKPKCKETGFSRDAFDVGVGRPDIILGTFTAKEVKVLIRLDGEDIFSISPPEKLVL